MTVEQTHVEAVNGDRMLFIQNGLFRTFGKWYEDHILDYVCDHGKEECTVKEETAEKIVIEVNDGNKVNHS